MSSSRTLLRKLRTSFTCIKPRFELSIILLYIAASVEQYCDITQVNALPQNEGILEGRTFSARFCISAMRLIVVLLAGSMVSGRIISVMSSTPCAVHCTEQVRPKSGISGDCTVHGARPFPGMLGLVLHCTGVVPWGAKDNYATPWVLMAYRVFGSSGQEQRHSPQGHDPT